MRIVKSLLLGSAAGLVAVAGAQAADLPVKAKPVEYVKICNLYGDGFFYIPGTETCIRIGSSAQADYYYNALGNGHPHYDAAAGAQDRTVSAHAMRVRLDIGVDSRTQTQYGTLRAYVQTRTDNADGNVNTLNMPRAFIQWAGFTFGHTRSYSDPLGAWGGGDGMKSIFQGQLHADSGANGTNQISYTWELGNGAVLVVGADERRNHALVNLSNASQVTVGSNPTTSRAGMMFPDPYVAFRLSQAWGGFTSAIHASNNNALYYTVNTPGFANCAVAPGQTVVGSTFCDHPKDKMGWASISGWEFKLPMIAPGDRVAGYIQYAVGASKYGFGNSSGSAGLFGGGNNVAMGWITDGVYLNGLGIQQTTSWAIAAAYEHWWNPQLETTVYAATGRQKYNNTVVAGGWFCGRGGAGAQKIVQIDPAQVCDPGFGFSDFRLKTAWYPVRGFVLAVEVMYALVDSAMGGQQISLAAAQGLRPTGIYTARDQGIAAINFRAQRGFGGVGE